MKHVAVALVLVLVACSAQSAPQSATVAPTKAQAWLHEVARAHAAADRAQSTVEAREALARVRAQPVPGSVSGADQQRILKDVQFRLALLALREADAQTASQEADRGLNLGMIDDEFTANLWIVKGRAEAKLGHTQDATQAYASALQIHDRLLDQALKGKP